MVQRKSGAKIRVIFHACPHSGPFFAERPSSRQPRCRKKRRVPPPPLRRIQMPGTKIRINGEPPASVYGRSVRRRGICRHRNVRTPPKARSLSRTRAAAAGQRRKRAARPVPGRRPRTKSGAGPAGRSAKTRQRQKIIRSSGGSEKCAPPYNRRRRKSPEPTARFAETTSSPARTALFGLPGRRNRGFPGGIHEAPPISRAIVPRHPKEHGAAHLAHRNAESETTPRKGKTGDSPPRFSPAFGRRAYKCAQKRKTRRIAGIFPAQIFAAR